MKDQLSIESLQNLNDFEMREINGGDSGDAAYWIGRSYVWGMAHFLTFGLSTYYLLYNAASEM